MDLPAFVLLVLVNPNVVDPGSYQFIADDREIGRFDIRKQPSTEIPQFRISVPAGAERLSIARAGRLPLIGTKVGARSTTVDLVSVAGITKPLRDERPADALLRLPAAADALLREVGSEFSSRDLGLEFGAKQTPDAIAQAEARLGYKLDPEITAVLMTSGPVRFGDHRMTMASDLFSTERQFMRLWGAEETRVGEAAALYGASTMVWVEAGDGYGAVLYAPTGPAGCDGNHAYWKIHQDTMDEPWLMGGADGRCGSLSDVLMAVIGEALLTQIEDNAAEGRLLVDPTMPDAFPVWLETDGDGKPRLRPDWSRLR
jgi:hypothetical protein